jgi:2-polyprenyl-3-methyl-5-hydroxy-6-metoxy-1,4-benzoquinol methylase
MDLTEIKKNEKSVLATFQQEIPSIHFSDKSVKEYNNHKERAEIYYRNLLNFPKDMFLGKNLIDFGAGTGENTVYLANWGAKCTLVEMNDKAQKISKEVFSNYTDNYDEHKFIQSSIFDFDEPSLYSKFDIVHCRGVLSHTADNGKAFDIISKYLKPGGYLIFGDPNKAGGFQNMLQRLIIYNFAKDWENMIRVSEELFSEDIDRAQKAGNRTRNCIIFDRWVVECQDDPSVEDVLSWFKRNKLDFYSAQPNFSLPLLGDSSLHKPRFYIENQGLKSHSLSELIWMTHTEDDEKVIPDMLKSVEPFADKLSKLTSMVSNTNPNTKINNENLINLLNEVASDFKDINFLESLGQKLNVMTSEIKEILNLININDYENLKAFLKKTKVLFKGSVGIRHNDYIAHKNIE